MGKVCLFLINGLGMGNSTRCHAVIQQLHARGAEIHVLTSGNGLRFFADKPEIASLTPMEAFFYSGGEGSISGLKTLLRLGSLLRLARRKSQQLEALLRTIKPDVAVLDSEYGVGPLRARHVPIVGLNNSDLVVSEFFKGTRDHAIWAHFWIVELMDYLFHKRVCDLVVSPSPVAGPPRHPKIRRVGLILRREVAALSEGRASIAFTPPRDCRRVLFMLSGSIFASAIPLETARYPFQIDVVGRDGVNREGVAFHGRQMNNLAFLKQADALVVNGGFCAVSEALALNKPAFVIPVKGHAEQAVNATLVQRLGHGFRVTDETVLDRLGACLRDNAWTGLAPKPPELGFDGAREAAGHICRLLGVADGSEAR
jgi:UDP:flavonoid glycosyltransferase YjiC (YdhE family)